MKKLIGSSLIAIAAALTFTGSSSAADVQGIQQAKSPWQIRVRALGVVPTDKGSVNRVGGGHFRDGGLEYSSSVVPELDISYFFNDNIAAELILGTTFSKISASGAGLKAAGVDNVGKVWILPPTLTLQYHFTNFGAFKPYVGAGVNYTVFYNQDAKGNVGHLDVDNEWGAALQVGFDYMFDDHWGFNMDVKKLYLRPDFSGRLADGTRFSGKAKLDPWLIGTGITYRF